MEKKSYYAIIPANVRYDSELTPNAKLLYGEITALCNDKGYCWASNKYFADLYEVSNVTISNWITQLVDKGYLYREIEYVEGTKEIKRRIVGIVPVGEIKIQKTAVKPKKKEKKNIMKEYTDNQVLRNSISEFVKMRKELGKPLTEQGLKLNLTKLDKLATTDEEKIEIVNQSVARTWRGFWPIKEKEMSKKANDYPDWYKNQEQHDASPELINEVDKMLKELGGN
jgi:hypothetical protein